MLQPPSSRPYGWNRYNQGRFRLPTSRQSRALAATNNAVLYHETKCHIQELIDTLPTTLIMSRVEDMLKAGMGWSRSMRIWMPCLSGKPLRAKLFNRT